MHIIGLGLQDVYLRSPLYDVDNSDDIILPSLTTSMKRRQRRAWQKMQQMKKKRSSSVICTSYRTIGNAMNLSCPITCEEFTGDDNVLVIRQCQHVFKADALRTWLELNPTCPICRCSCHVYNV